MKPPGDLRSMRTPRPAAAGRRTPVVLLCLLIPVALLGLAGCGNGTGGLASAGPTPTASGPVHLWPSREGASVQPADPGGAPPEYVPGLPPVTGQDVHQVDPVALVQAELAVHGDRMVGPDGMPAETAAAIRACEPGQAGDEGGRGGQCPVLKPYYRDLTGNRRDDLVIGIELPGPEQLMSVRVYTADPDGRLNRIMATTEPVISVELAGQDLILRMPSANPGYELSTAWSYDDRQRSMLPTREQITRVPSPASAGTGPLGTPSPAASPVPSAA
ncbi:hypothetical protein [Streptomyces venezuelae]|uniref:hypothetical protein n=1 Tax=Streptomyces venezuelae TaxID=54571 RepID=UPI001CC23CAB|nr:hypothetical protein [Streptomyces venezuelae]